MRHADGRRRRHRPSQLDGTNQYVTFGAAPALGVTNFTLETWFKRTGAGVGVTTGTGGIASAIPLVTKGGAEAESRANVNMNYFLGIDAASGVLVADFEEADGPTPASTTRSAARHGRDQQRLAPRRRDLRRGTGTWRLYLDGTLDGTLVLTGSLPRRDRQHPARRARHVADLDRRDRQRGGFFAGVDRRGPHLERRPQRRPDPGRPRSHARPPAPA